MSRPNIPHDDIIRNVHTITRCEDIQEASASAVQGFSHVWTLSPEHLIYNHDITYRRRPRSKL